MFLWVGISTEVYAQLSLSSMKDITHLYVSVVPFSRVNLENQINSYEFIGRTERSFQNVGALITSENKASGKIVTEVQIQAVGGVGFVYNLTIRFNRDLQDNRTKKTIPVTVWQRTKLNFSNKMNLKKSILSDYDVVLEEFVADYSEANN